MIEKEIINAAIIGYGLSGRVFHAPFLHEMKEFNLKSIVQRHGNSSSENYPDASIIRDYRELLKDEALDLVIICTPNTTHFPMAKACLEAGKHVIIDKPFVTTTKEADTLMRVSKEAGKEIFVYQNRRWDGDFLTIRTLLAENILGDILEYEAHFDRYRPLVPQDKWREEDKPGGGIVYDLGSHLIDQALVLFGMPQAISADIREQRSNSKVDDYFNIHLFYPGHNVVLKAGMFARMAGPRYKIHGRKASYIKYGLDPQEMALKNGVKPLGEKWGHEDEENWGELIYEEDGRMINRKVETVPGAYQDFYQNVFDVLVHGQDLLVKPWEAAGVISLIELAFESSASKEIRKII